MEKIQRYLQYTPHKSNGTHRRLVKEVQKRLKHDFSKDDLFVEETEYAFWRKDGVDGEIDNLVIHKVGDKRFILVFEDKSTNKEPNRKKAKKQLKKEKKFLQKIYPKAKIYCFYVYYNYKKKKPEYKLLTEKNKKV